MTEPSETQEQLPLEDRRTFLTPAPREVKPSPEEEAEFESSYKRVMRIMRENQED